MAAGYDGTRKGGEAAMARMNLENRKSTYRLHLDIHRYFLSIHRLTLFELFIRRLRDKRL